MLQIAVMNQSSVIADDEVLAMLPAFETKWNRDLDPVWGVGGARFRFVAAKKKPPRRAWWVVFLDDSDQADALAYHDLTDEGLPISKVFVKTLRADKASVSVGATHEICEMAVDPWLNGAYQDLRNRFWASEVCDPVEGDRYGYRIGKVLVTNFVTPRWFAYDNARGPIDFQQHEGVPFQLLPQGYAQKWTKAGWRQVNGPAVRAKRALNPPKGSRRERRERSRSQWKLSDLARAGR